MKVPEKKPEPERPEPEITWDAWQNEIAGGDAGADETPVGGYSDSPIQVAGKKFRHDIVAQPVAATADFEDIIAQSLDKEMPRVEVEEPDNDAGVDIDKIVSSMERMEKVAAGLPESAPWPKVRAHLEVPVPAQAAVSSSVTSASPMV